MRLFGRRLVIYNPLDFEARVLTDWQRLRAVHDYLAFVAASSAEGARQREVAFAQGCCADLLRQGEQGREPALLVVRAQIARAARVARSHEGLANRVVRRYW